MTDLHTAILDKITKENGGVSFVELSRIDGFKGDHAIVWGEHLVLWAGISVEALDVISQALKDNLYHMMPTRLLVYAVDGATLSLPIAKSMRDYKTDHWMPVVFNPGPAPVPKK